MVTLTKVHPIGGADDRENASDDSVQPKGCCVAVSCTGLLCMGVLTLLVLSIASFFKTLGSEEQLVVAQDKGRQTINGPGTFFVEPGTIIFRRDAVRLPISKYAVVVDHDSGQKRHEEGPLLLFLGAWDVLVDVSNKVVVGVGESVRLVNTLTGSERRVVGPCKVVPAPDELAPDGVIQEATAIAVPTLGPR